MDEYDEQLVERVAQVLLWGIYKEKQDPDASIEAFARHVLKTIDDEGRLCEPRGPVHVVMTGRYYAKVVDGTPKIFRADTGGAVLAVEDEETTAVFRT